MKTKLVIEEWWEEMSLHKDPRTNMYTPIRGKYYLRHITVMPGKGWDSDAQFYWARSDGPGYIGETWSEEHQCSAFQFNLGRQGGVNSYQLVYPCREVK